LEWRELKIEVNLEYHHPSFVVPEILFFPLSLTKKRSLITQPAKIANYTRTLVSDPQIVFLQLLKMVQLGAGHVIVEGTCPLTVNLVLRP
jgi:hypothetical protein